MDPTVFVLRVCYAMQRPRDGRIYGSVSGQLLGKQVAAATNLRVTTEVPLETGCFYVVRAEELP
jgi:hypothetical protein